MPWHLTTQEAMTEVRSGAGPDGLYVMNLIDRGPLAFARAEVATLADSLRPRAVASPPAAFHR